MLVATPGQTTAYALHNNSGNTTTTANIPAGATVSSAAANSASASVCAKKSAALKVSSSAAVKCVNNNGSLNHNASTTVTATTIIPQTLTTVAATSFANRHHSFSFSIPLSKKDVGNGHRSSASITAKGQPQSHSLQNNDIQRPPSFLNAFKDSVQKALVTTATTLARNGAASSIALGTLHNSSAGSKTMVKPNSFTSASSSSLAATLLGSASKSSTFSSIASSAKSAQACSSALSLPLAQVSSSKSTLFPLTVNRKQLVELHTIPPTQLHRCAEERQKTSSVDSLQKEMCHFKPIRAAPTTPWKSGSKSRGCSLRFPKAILADAKKTEFISKSSCDLNIRRRKLPPPPPPAATAKNNTRQKGRHRIASTVTNSSQENKLYHETYRPKSSSLYTAFNPNRHSAFVCIARKSRSKKTPTAMASNSPSQGLKLEPEELNMDISQADDGQDESSEDMHTFNVGATNNIGPTAAASHAAPVETSHASAQTAGGKRVSRKRKAVAEGRNRPVSIVSHSSSALKRSGSVHPPTVEAYKEHPLFKYPQLQDLRVTQIGQSPPPMTRSALRNLLEKQKSQEINGSGKAPAKKQRKRT